MSELSGPPPTGFAHALREAIAASGLSLNRIQYRLGERGVPVSSATLSYWQSGRRRPTRRESVAVVRALEEILRVPEGSLTALLDPTATRRRTGARPGAEIEALWEDPRTARLVRQRFSAAWTPGLTRISAHDRYEVGVDRRIRRIWHRQVLRAEEDGPDRWVVLFREDSPEDPLPEVRAVWHCRVGAVEPDPVARLLFAELLFDRTLSRGDTWVMEYELRYPGLGALARERYERKFPYPVREHVLELLFDPAARPARCQQYTVPAGEEAERVRALDIDESGYVHAVATDVPPGRRGIRWEWPVNS